MAAGQAETGVCLARLMVRPDLAAFALAAAGVAAAYGALCHAAALPLVVAAPCVAAGLVLWTLMEYGLHRWVLHARPSPSGAQRLLRSGPSHRVHHARPQEVQRTGPLAFAALLVLSPVGALILWAGFTALTPWPPAGAFAVSAGLVVGAYLHEVIHAACHHARMKGPVLARIKRFHAIHHHRDDTMNFGVTSSVWDYVFGTHHVVRRAKMRSAMLIRV